MDNNKERSIRNILRLFSSIIFIALYLPHLAIFLFGNKDLRNLIIKDLDANSDIIGFSIPKWLQLLYHLHNDRYYRVIFYHRIGPILKLLISWYRPGDRCFIISGTTKIDGSIRAIHPYATVLNAEAIGKNSRCIHMTTIGIKNNIRPIIGDNVEIGANLTIIGNVKRGNDVIIGAGSVVIKDLPDTCVAVGNPCRPIKVIS